eukprot:TRINITY_DN3240_c0_g1_i1.p1 TRINITY_DN3240_c0_g1~~TRINITY_DN3240_c0_g1_i1.p1  ORF type:complete len:749 (-),score=131.76 TRINITY_DN3240_c0_g1_i1:193-2439(-)
MSLGLYYWALLCLLISLTGAQNVTRIKIGITYMDGPAVQAGQLIFANSTTSALKMWSLTKGDGNFTGKDGNQYVIDIVALPDNSNFTEYMGNIRTLCADPDIMAIVTPVNADYSYATIPIVDNSTGCNKIAIVPNALGKSYYTTWKLNNTFEVSTHLDNMFDNMYPNFRYAKIFKLSVIYGDQPFLVASCNIPQSKVSAYGLEIVHRGAFNSTYAPTITEGQRAQLHKAIDDAIDAGAEGLITCAFDNALLEMLSYARYTRNYAFKAVVTLPDRQYEKKNMRNLTDYLFVIINVNSQIQLQEVDNEYFYTQKRMFDMHSAALNGTYPTDFFFFTYYGLALFREGLKGAISMKKEDVVSSISRLNFQTVGGSIVFDGSHYTQFQQIVAQHYNGSIHVVWPPAASASPYIIPVPTWEERMYTGEYHGSEVVFMAIAGVFIAITFGLLFAVFHYRKHSIITVSMPIFLMMTCIGAILVFMSTFFWLFHNLSTFTCIFRVWLVGVGFCLIYAPLFAKSFYVYRLWSASLAKNVVITQPQLLGFVGLITSIQVVLLIVYSAAGNVRAIVHVLDGDRPAMNREMCAHDDVGTVFISLMVAYGFLNIVAGLVLSWLTRKVTFLAFNESKVLLASMYNVAFFSLLAVLVVGNSNLLDPVAEFSLRSVCVLLSAAMTIFILLGNKFWLINNNKTAKSKRTTTMGITQTRNSSAEKTDSGAEVDKEIAQLKTQLEKAEARIKELEDQLNQAQISAVAE